MQTYLDQQREFFQSEATKSYTFRIEQLKKLKQAIITHEHAILDALKKDLNKSSFEAYTTEIGFTLLSIKSALRSLKRWMRIKKVPTPFYQLIHVPISRMNP